MSNNPNDNWQNTPIGIFLKAFVPIIILIVLIGSALQSLPIKYKPPVLYDEKDFAPLSYYVYPNIATTQNTTTTTSFTINTHVVFPPKTTTIVTTKPTTTTTTTTTIATTSTTSATTKTTTRTTTPPITTSLSWYDNYLKTKTTVSEENAVYVTNTGEKYHRRGCRYLKYSSRAISRDWAIDRGYEPCKVCRP